MIFYGTTPYGRRIHIGNWISPRHRSRENFVFTFCGNEMTAWEEGERPPSSKADEFCKVCFRSFAWEYFVVGIKTEVYEPAYNKAPVYRPAPEKIFELAEKLLAR